VSTKFCTVAPNICEPSKWNLSPLWRLEI
jgi:hypothetical protein